VAGRRVAMVAAVSATIALLGEWGLVILVFGFGAAVLRRLDRRREYSFGQGFLGYRAESGWPRGVQEDDDMHWVWPSPSASRDPGRLLRG